MHAADDLCDAWADLDEQMGWRDTQLVGVEKIDEDGNVIGRVEEGDWEEDILQARRRLTTAVEGVVESAPAAIAVLGQSGHLDVATQLEDLRQSLTRPLCPPGEDVTDHLIEGPALFVKEFVTAWTARQGVRATMGALVLTLAPPTTRRAGDDPERDILLTSNTVVASSRIGMGAIAESAVRDALAAYWESLRGALRRLNLYRESLDQLRVDLGSSGHVYVSQADVDVAPRPSPLALRCGRALLALGELESFPGSNVRVVNGTADRLGLISRVYAPWRARQSEERAQEDGSGFAASTAQVAAECLGSAAKMLPTSPSFGLLNAEAGIAAAGELLLGSRRHYQSALRINLPSLLETLAQAEGLPAPWREVALMLSAGRASAEEVLSALDRRVDGVPPLPGSPEAGRSVGPPAPTTPARMGRPRKPDSQHERAASVLRREKRPMSHEDLARSPQLQDIKEWPTVMKRAMEAHPGCIRKALDPDGFVTYEWMAAGAEPQ